MKVPRFHFLWTLLFTVIIIGVILSAGYVYAARNLTYSNLFLPNTTVNGINIGGLSLEEARTTLAPDEEKKIKSKSFSIICEDSLLTLDTESLFTSDLESVLTQALDITRSETDIMKKMDKLLSAYSNGETAFQTHVKSDDDLLKETIHEFARQFYVAPVLPNIEINSSGNIEFSKEAVGRYVDEDELFQKINNQFNNGITTDIAVSVMPLMPKETAQTLKDSIHLIAVSEIGDGRNLSDNSFACNANIELLINKIRGKVIPSGETFSMRQFLEDNVAQGELMSEPEDIREDGIGQFAGLFYQAALLTDMEIIERAQQPYPSKHLPLGLDALIDGTHDLVVKNTSDYPMYFIASKTGDSAKIEVFGARPAKYTIKVDLQVLEPILPPAPEIIYDPALEPGIQEIIVNAMDGGRVKTLRQYFINNVYDHEVLISMDDYKPIQGVVHQG